ncbi:kinase-like domain-containing protein [Mycena amicta]|nr:kinase-like domain-containing protein [Mycena amicta]
MVYNPKWAPPVFTNEIYDKRWFFQKVIAQGGHSQIYKVVDLKPDEETKSHATPFYVAKYLCALEPDSYDGTRDAEAEIRHHRAVSEHPNVCTLYFRFTHRGYLFAMLQLAEGTLGECIDAVSRDSLHRPLHALEGRLPSRLLNRPIFSVTRTLPTSGITDFGISFDTRKLTTSGGGTGPYVSPETLYREPHRPARDDNWALCILLINMLTDGRFPWRRCTVEDRHYDSFKRDRQFLHTSFPMLSTRLTNFLTRCFHPYARYRPGLEDLIKEIEEMPSMYANPSDFRRIYVLKGLRVPPRPRSVRMVTVRELKEEPEYVAGAEGDWEWEDRELETKYPATFWGEHDQDEHGIPLPAVPDPCRLEEWMDEFPDVWAYELPHGEIITPMHAFVAEKLAGSRSKAKMLAPSSADDDSSSIAGSSSSSTVVGSSASLSAPSSHSRRGSVATTASSSTLPTPPDDSQLRRIELTFRPCATKLRRTRSSDCVLTARPTWDIHGKGKGKAPELVKECYVDDDEVLLDDEEVERRRHLRNIVERRNKNKEQGLRPSDWLFWFDHSHWLIGHYRMPAGELPDPCSWTPPIHARNLGRGDPRHMVKYPAVPRGVIQDKNPNKLHKSRILRIFSFIWNGRSLVRDPQFRTKTTEQIFAGDYGIGEGLQNSRRAKILE